MHNAKVLAKRCQRKEEIHSVDDVELAHYQNALSEENHCKKQKKSNAAQKFIDINHNTKSHSASMKVGGAHLVPLLLDKGACWKGRKCPSGASD